MDLVYLFIKWSAAQYAKRPLSNAESTSLVGLVCLLTPFLLFSWVLSVCHSRFSAFVLLYIFVVYLILSPGSHSCFIMFFLWSFLALCVLGQDIHSFVERSESAGNIEARQQAGVASSDNFLRRAYHGCQYKLGGVN
jgi:hypothetical protein